MTLKPDRDPVPAPPASETLVAAIRSEVLAELIRRASEGCEGPLDSACGKTRLPMSQWCDPCRCQVAAKQIELQDLRAEPPPVPSTPAKNHGLIKMLRLRAQFLLNLPHTSDGFGDDVQMNESSASAISKLLNEAADRLEPPPAPPAVRPDIIADMQQASDLIDEAAGTSECTARLVALALIARHFLRELAREAEREAASPAVTFGTTTTNEGSAYAGSGMLVTYPELYGGEAPARSPAREPELRKCAEAVIRAWDLRQPDVSFDTFNDTIEKLEAALASPSSSPTGWQPIKTALEAAQGELRKAQDRIAALEQEEARWNRHYLEAEKLRYAAEASCTAHQEKEKTMRFAFDQLQARCTALEQERGRG